MRRKMLVSSLAVCAVAFSCLTLLLGRTSASAADERGAGPATDQANGTEKAKGAEEKSAEGARGAGSDYSPSRVDRDQIRSATGTGSWHRPYYAIFDAATGETRTFPAPLSGDFPPRETDFRGGRRRQIEPRRRVPGNFVSRDILKDSEMELRVRFGGLTAKETMISSGIDENTGKRQGLKLRQLTDGENFIQLIYNMEDDIQDCEFIRQKDLADKFLREFERDLDKAEVAYEIERKVHEIRQGETGKVKGGGHLDEDYFEGDEGGIENYRAFSEEEKREVEDKEEAEEEEEEEEEPEDADSPYQIRNVTFQIIQSEKDFPRDIALWLNYRKLEENCKRTQTVLKKLVHHSQNGDVKSKKLARKRLERKKRDLMDVFRMPGTKWCGKGKRAAKYTSLGVFSRTDKCCRIHDTVCPYWIGGFQEKYGLFNWKLNTIMHCRCDKRFRACLKMAKTGAANLVGKLFFNIVQTQCFVLKPEEVCVKMSWWGKCEKKEYRKKAYLRDNVSY